jgi:hypothetical protein
MKSISFFMVVISLAATFSVSAAPVIDRIQPTTDGYIEIFGSGFGVKEKVQPLVWLDFESPSSLLSRPLLSLEPVNGILTKDLLNQSNTVLEYDAKSRGAGGPQGVKFNSDELYINLRRYYKFSIDDSRFAGSTGGVNLKTVRLWAGFDAPNINNIYLGYQGKEGVNSGRIFTEYTDEIATWTGSTAPQRGHKWLNEEIIYKTSNIDAHDGIFQYILNGERAKSKPVRNRTSARPKKYEFLYFDQVSNYSLTAPLEIIYDDLYVDDSYHRVILTDSESPQDYSRAIVQIPVEWKDDYIKVKMRTMDQTGTGLYLHVYDGNNKTSKKGVRFCPECPKPPSL